MRRRARRRASGAVPRADSAASGRDRERGAGADGLQVQVLRDETELEAVRRTRDTVLANISHEFRTPLAAQLASIELLRDGLGTMNAKAQRELVSSLAARHAAADMAHRQPARERTHRVGPARDPASGRRCSTT